MNLQTENRLDIAVLSDIHGNYVALESCLAHAVSQNIKTFLFLGDYVSELAYPERTMKLLYEMDRTCSCRFIRGNKEEFSTVPEVSRAGRTVPPPAAPCYIHTVL